MQGQTLTVAQGSWTGTPAPAVTDQWQRCDTTGVNCADVTGATSPTYVLASADVGATLRVNETAANIAGIVTAASSSTATCAVSLSHRRRGHRHRTVSANIWVDTNGGSCSRSSSPVAYSDPAACGTFQAAYNLAAPGDVVRVKCGDYSAKNSTFVNIAYNAAKDNAGAATVFTSEDGTRGCVTLPNVAWTIQSGWVEFDHFTMDQTACVNSATASVPPCPSVVIQSKTTNSSIGAHNVTVNDIQASTVAISGGVSFVTITNSDFGPAYDNHGILHCNGSVSPCTAMPHDITFINDSVHDGYNTTACTNNIPAGCLGNHHMGCAITINNGYNLLFDRTHFYNCTDLPFYVHPYLSEIHDVTVENSDIGRGTQPTQMENDWITSSANFGYWNIRFISNTFGGPVSLLPSTVRNVCAGQGRHGWL